jgi:phosphoribosylglycinamide formyltransferase 2
MGVALVNSPLETPIEDLVEKAKKAATLVKVHA